MDILQLFANPAMLTAGILAAAPLVIHLLSRLRAREMDFPTLRFLKQTTEKTSRRRRIENWLLLILRTLALLMLTLAAAGPILPGGSFFGGSGISSIILFDDSLSTDRQQFRQSSTRAVRETIRSQPSGSRWSLRYNCRPYDGSQLQRLSSHPQQDTQAALKPLPPSGACGKLARRCAEAIAELATQKGRSTELVIITDGQQSEWEKLAQYCSGIQIPRNLRIYLFAPHLTTMNNASPGDIALQMRLPLPGEKASLKQSIQYFGNENFNGSISCFYENSQQSKQELQLAAQSNSSTDLFFTTNKIDWNNGFTVVNGDDFIADNKRVFAVKTLSKLDVLLLGENEQTFKQAYPFLNSALAPLPQLPVSITTAPQGQLAQIPLEKFAAIFLCLDQTPSKDTVARLYTYAKNGGTLIAFPGTKLDIQQWNNQWRSVYDASVLGRITAKIDFSKSPCGIQAQVNAMQLFTDMTQQNLQLLTKVKISKAFNINANDTNASEILTLFNSLPFMLSQEYGKGKLILFSSPPVNDWGLLQARPVFVPLMLSLLKLGPIITAPQSECGTPLNLCADENHASIKAEITFPSGKKETKTFTNVSKSNPALLRNTMLPGIYNVLFPELKKEKKFAVNPTTQEADLTSFNINNLPKLNEYGTLYYSDTPEELATSLHSTRKDLSLKLPLEIILLVLLAAEGIIGMRRGMRQNI